MASLASKLLHFFKGIWIRPNRFLCIPILATAVLLSSCSVKQMAMNQIGDALAGGGTVFSSDDDPELIKEALPFSLKLMESVLAEVPEHEGLLLNLCSSFAQYSYGFVQLEADEVEDEDYHRSVELRERAKNLCLRAKRYGMRGLEVRHPGLSEALALDLENALANVEADDVPYLYWTALSWMGAIVLSLDDPQLVGELAIPEAMMEKVLSLDPDWDSGSVHSFFITYEMGRLTGSGDPVAKATMHFNRALELSGGQMASVYVAYAESVAVEQQDKEKFTELLNQALSIDIDARPELRLANRLYQRRAKWLLTRLDWLFL